MSNLVNQTVWQGCYEKRHGKLITKESVRHPAKMAVGLCERIFDYGLERGYWRKGDTFIDPFNGIGTSLLVGAFRGYRMLGVELEQHFVELALDNIELNRRNLSMLSCPLPVVVQGDSRYLRRVLTARLVTGAVSSPPYADTDIASKTGAGSYGQNFAETGKSPRALDQMGAEKYGVADGQLSAMKPGDLESVAGSVTSPPFMGQLEDGGWQLLGKYAAEGKLNVAQVNGDPSKTYPSWNRERDTSYGHSEGQLADLPAGDLAQVTGAVTSPPFAGNSGGTGVASSGPINERYPGLFERSLGGMNNGAAYGESAGQINAMRQDQVENVIGEVTVPVTSPITFTQGYNSGGGINKTGYKDGDMVGDRTYQGTGNERNADNVEALSGETYWSACALIYRELMAVLKPGGVAALVVKNYVKAGVIVDLVGQTERLLKALGYEHIETILASLVKETTTPTLFGEIEVKRIERKGFFRRLHEKKRPNTRIDYEAVIWCRKPGA